MSKKHKIGGLVALGTVVAAGAATVAAVQLMKKKQAEETTPSQFRDQ